VEEVEWCRRPVEETAGMQAGNGMRARWVGDDMRGEMRAATVAAA
jgi:hypothetical protein